MEPRWVRPAYYYLLSLIGVLAMAVGAILLLLGAVHAASPDLQRQGDPVFRAVSSVLDVVEVVAEETTESPLPVEVEQSLDEARKELDSQARDAGFDQLITGLVVFLVGFAIFLLHWRRAEQLGAPAQPRPEPPSPAARSCPGFSHRPREAVDSTPGTSRCCLGR